MEGVVYNHFVYIVDVLCIGRVVFRMCVCVMKKLSYTEP